MASSASCRARTNSRPSSASTQAATNQGSGKRIAATPATPRPSGPLSKADLRKQQAAAASIESQRPELVALADQEPVSFGRQVRGAGLSLRNRQRVRKVDLRLLRRVTTHLLKEHFGPFGT